MASVAVRARAAPFHIAFPPREPEAELARPVTPRPAIVAVLNSHIDPISLFRPDTEAERREPIGGRTWSGWRVACGGTIDGMDGRRGGTVNGVKAPGC